MPQTSRELVRRCLTFNHPERIPRDLGVLPWAWDHHREDVEAILQRFPNDLGEAVNVYKPSPRVRGNRHHKGIHVDEWGCEFENAQDGIIGEVKKPIISEISQWQSVLEPPYEILPDDWQRARDEVNRHYGKSDLFIKAACCPRPWERYQFLRGTVNAMMDVMEPDLGLLDLLRAIHEFHLKELEFWVSTDVDSIMFMDDWGMQNQLLISPKIWREFFKPLYKDYCDLIHAHGKFAFMHSDGNIQAIYPDLIEVGVDALNSQLFCMDIPELARLAKGKITFWGEIDRQQVLTSPDPEIGRQAVRRVAEHLYDPAGGVIAQFEFSLGTQPQTAMAICEEWERISAARS